MTIGNHLCNRYHKCPYILQSNHLYTNLCRLLCSCSHNLYTPQNIFQYNLYNLIYIPTDTFLDNQIQASVLQSNLQEDSIVAMLQILAMFS